MIERIGYFKEFDHDTYEYGTRCIVRGKINTYKDHIPKDDSGDCYRVSLVDGALMVEKWMSARKDFVFVMASSSFKIEQIW